MAARLATQEAALAVLLAEIQDLRESHQRWEAVIDEVMDVLLAARAAGLTRKPSGTHPVC